MPSTEVDPRTLTTDDRRWEQHVHHLLWETYTRMIAVADAEFGDAELTLPAIGTLDMIGTWPGSTVAELSRRTPKTQQAISQLVAKLEKLGLVERRLGTGRGVGLHLTEAGLKARADGNRKEQALEDRLRGMLGPELYDELEAALDRARECLRD
jgi:DNA-binding MarR family transcriptional regulator